MTGSNGGRKMRARRAAVVFSPGMATRFPRRSSVFMGVFAMTTGPYPSPMLAPVARIQYLSARSRKAWAETAVTSSSPSKARRFRVSMSSSACSILKSRMRTAPFERAQNMKASSGSGLWPMRRVGGIDTLYYVRLVAAA
jgi:hypothetical protein